LLLPELAGKVAIIRSKHE